MATLQFGEKTIAFNTKLISKRCGLIDENAKFEKLQESQKSNYLLKFHLKIF